MSSLANFRLFDGVNPLAREALAARSVERVFAANQVLFTAGSPPVGFFVILEGEVRVLRGGLGRQHVVHVEGPGGTLGEVALFDGGGYPATAIASRATRCILFTRAAVEAAIRADPAVAWIFFRRLAGRVRHLVDRLDRLAAHSVTSRLATLLQVRRREAGAREFSLGRSQAQVAENSAPCAKYWCGACGTFEPRESSVGQGAAVMKSLMRPPSIGLRESAVNAETGTFTV